MTLLRRAPREVYRVYGEDEFFAVAASEERFEPTGGRVERRRHRVAGATVLLAATGAVGGLIALNSLSAATSARRRAGVGVGVGVGPLTATRSLASSRAARIQVWREPPSTGGSRPPRLRKQGAAQRAGRLRVMSGTSTRRLVSAGQPATAVRRARASERTALGGERAQSPPMAAPAQPVQVTASEAAAPQRAGQSEFGFER